MGLDEFAGNPKRVTWGKKGWPPFSSGRSGKRWQAIQGGGGGPPPPPFDPKTIPGIVYQFDPSDAASVTLVGGDIDVIQDLNGNWAMYAGGVASRMPTVETINGLNAARYHVFPDADYLRLCDAGLTAYQTYNAIYGGSQSWTQFVVIQVVGAGGVSGNTWQNAGVMDEGGYNGFYVKGGTPQYYRCYYYANSSVPVTQYDTYVEFTEAGGPGTAMQLMMKFSDPGFPNVGTLYASRDGGAYSSQTGGVLYRDIYNILQGVGYGFGANSYLDGKVGECIAYDRELTAGEVTQVTDYLRTKWGLP